MDSLLARNLRFLYWEAAFALAYDTWIGSTYLSGLAGEAGVGLEMVTLLAAAPWLGWLGQVMGSFYFSNLSETKRYALLTIGWARGVWILPFGFAVYWARTRDSFPTQIWFVGLAFTACLSSLLASSSASAWYSWIRAIVPTSIHGRFFGVRQSFVMASVVIANLLAASLVGWKREGQFYGYAALGIAAILAGVISTTVMSRVSAPDRSLDEVGPRQSFHDYFISPFRDVSFRALVIYAAGFNCAVQLAGPFFPYYYTHNLGIPMSRVALWTVVGQTAAFAAAQYWGRLIDKTLRLERLTKYLGFAIAISPLFYLRASPGWVSAVAPAEFVMNGIAWAGHVLALSTLLLARTPLTKNINYFSIYIGATGIAGGIGAWAGGTFVHFAQGLGGFRALFVVAVLFRLGVAAYFGKRLEATSPKFG